MSGPLRERLFQAGDGTWYRVRLSYVHPQRGWVIPGQQWLGFETREGTYVGALPVELGWSLAGLKDERLEALLHDVTGRE